MVAKINGIIIVFFVNELFWNPAMLYTFCVAVVVCSLLVKIAQILQG